MHSLFPDKLNKDEIEYLIENTVFCSEEITHLFERFTYLDKYKVGHLTYAECEMIPEFASNPFKSFILNYIEGKILRYEKMNFAYFLDFMQIFHKKTPKKQRIEFLFYIFDLNKDGKLCSGVLTEIQKILSLPDNNEEVIEILDEFDTDKKGYLDICDFTRMYNEDEYFEKITTIDFMKSITQPERKSTIWDIIWNTTNE